MKTALVRTFVALLAFGMLGIAQAAPVTYQFRFAAPQGSAQALGTVTFESTLLPNPGVLDVPLPDPSVLALNVTLTGTTGGDGTFTLADFNGLVFDTGGATLDLSRQVVGQPTAGSPWGTPDSNGGDFNLFGGGACQNMGAPTSGRYGTHPAAPSSPTAAAPPVGVWYFTLGAACGTAEQMVLVSFAPAGAASATTAPALAPPLELLLGGLLGIVALVALRRRGAR